MISLGIIIVDYQSDPLLDEAISSIRSSQVQFKFKIVVVENCPIKHRLDSPQDSEIQFLPQRGNLGFARAVNLARYQLSTPYLLVMNPDTRLLPETLSTLYGYLEKHKNVGLVVPKLISPNRSLQFSARRFYDFPTVLFRRTFLGRIFPNHPIIRRHLMADWDHNDVREIDWALGACMMIRAEAVGEAVFDSRFFLYFEDVDLCLRLRKAGWRVVYHPQAVAIHDHRQSSRKKLLSRANYEHLLSWIKFVLKHRSISGV